MKKIIYVSNTDWYLYNFRLNLMKRMLNETWEVVAVSPPGPFAVKLEAAGIRFVSLEMDRKGKNPLRDGKLFWKLRGIYRHESPDLVHHFTIKPVIYGTLAASSAGKIPVVNAVTGRGSAFMKRSWVGIAAEKLYKISLRRSAAVIFQNREDMKFFKDKGLIQNVKTYMIPGSGVDTKRFSPSEKRREKGKDKIVFLMISRMLWDKGVNEFYEAAEMARAQYREAEFWLVGGTDPGNPSGIPEKTLRALEKKGVIKWWGFQEDAKKFCENADVIVLPSYLEGLPKTLLEGAAMEKPLIATDTPGCRDVVKDGVTGLLVPVKDAGKLAEAMAWMIENPEERKAMGKRGRQQVLVLFSDEIVIRKTLEVYSQVLGGDSKFTENRDRGVT